MEARNLDSGYYIERKDSEKKVIVHFDGFTKPEMVEAFLKDYEILKKSVDVKNIELYLNGKTLKALKGWKFYPGQEGWVEIPYRWTLKGGAQPIGPILRTKRSASYIVPPTSSQN